jgi:hypothetical protein
MQNRKQKIIYMHAVSVKTNENTFLYYCKLCSDEGKMFTEEKI